MAGGARWPPDEVVPSSDPIGDEAWGVGESGDTSTSWLRSHAAGAAPPALQPSPIPDSLPASERIRLEARRRAAAAVDEDIFDDEPTHAHQALLIDDSDDSLASPFASPAASPRRTSRRSPRRSPQTASPQQSPGDSSFGSPRQRPRRAAAQRTCPYAYKPSLKRPTSDTALRERFGMPAPIVNQAPSPERRAAATFDALIRERRRALRRGLDSVSLRSVDAVAAGGIQAEIRAAQALMNAGHDARSSVSHAGRESGGPSATDSSVADASALSASLAGLGADKGTERLAHLLAEDASHGGLLHATNAPLYATFWPSPPERMAVQVEADWWRSEPAAVQVLAEAYGDERRLAALLRNSALSAPSHALCRWLLHLAVDRSDGAHAATDVLAALARQSSAVAQQVEHALPEVLCRLGASPDRIAACCGQDKIDEVYISDEAAAGRAIPGDPHDTQERRMRAASLLTTVAAVRAASGRGLSSPTVLALLSHLGAQAPPSAAVEVFFTDVMTTLERRGSGSRSAAASAWERLVQSSVGLDPSEQLVVLRTLPASTPFTQRFRARAAVGMLVRSAPGVPRTDAGAPLAWLLELLTHPDAGFLKPAGADTRNYAQMNAMLGQLALATSDLDELVPSTVRHDTASTPAELEAAAHFLQALGTLYREIEDRRGMHAERSQAKSFVQRLQLRLRYQIETRVRASGARDVWATLAGHA